VFARSDLYDVEDFVNELRSINVAPYVAAKGLAMLPPRIRELLKRSRQPYVA